MRRQISGLIPPLLKNSGRFYLKRFALKGEYSELMSLQIVLRLSGYGYLGSMGVMMPSRSSIASAASRHKSSR